MTTQLTFDNLTLVSKEISQASIKDVFNISLVSKAVHEFIYPFILKVDGAQYSVFKDRKVCTERDEHAPIPRSLKFFLDTDNAKLVGSFLEHLNLSPYTMCHAHPRCQTILCVAVQAGAVSVVDFLLKEEANPRSDSHDNQSSDDAQKGKDLQLLKCVESVDHRYKNTITQKLLQCCSNVNQRNEDGYTVLHQVVRNVVHNSSSEIIKSLIEAGVKIDALSRGEGSYGRLIPRTALNYACLNARPRVIQALLENGALAQGALAFDVTGPPLVKFQRRTGFSYKPPVNESQVPLTYAASSPLYDLLLGADEFWEEQMVLSISIFDSDGYTHGLSLWNAQKADVYESAKLLIHHGLVGPQGLFSASRDVIVDISTVCAESKFDYLELWALLVETGVLDVHRRNEFGQTFLNQLASRCCGRRHIRDPAWKPDLLRKIVEVGSDPNTVDDSGMTPLHWAILFNDFDLAKLLIELGANPAKEINGATPTHYAFGKPFARRGPVAHKVISALRWQLTKLLPSNAPRLRMEVFSRYRKCKWHPVLSICSSPLMRARYPKLVKDAERQMFSIMALLSPFATTGRDENGNTPREIAENIGLLKEGDSLVLRPGLFHAMQRSSYPFHLFSSRFHLSCEDDCYFCFSFPRRPLDLGTGNARPIPLTHIEVITDGQVSSFPAEINRSA